MCHATRCWPARKRCYRCDAPRDTVPNNLPWVLWDGHPHSRVVLVQKLNLQWCSLLGTIFRVLWVAFLPGCFKKFTKMKFVPPAAFVFLVGV